MDTYTDPAVRTYIQENIAALEAYRRGNARDLVETMLSGVDPEEFDTELLIEALLEADPYEREFNDIDTAGFWEIARRYSREILTGDTVTFGKHGRSRWVVLATYRDAVLLESPRKVQRTIRRDSGKFLNLHLVLRHGRPDLHV